MNKSNPNSILPNLLAVGGLMVLALAYGDTEHGWILERMADVIGWVILIFITIAALGPKPAYAIVEGRNFNSQRFSIHSVILVIPFALYMPVWASVLLLTSLTLMAARINKNCAASEKAEPKP